MGKYETMKSMKKICNKKQELFDFVRSFCMHKKNTLNLAQYKISSKEV